MAEFLLIGCSDNGIGPYVTQAQNMRLVTGEERSPSTSTQGFENLARRLRLALQT
jgi:hypothetical protein